MGRLWLVLLALIVCALVPALGAEDHPIRAQALHLRDNASDPTVRAMRFRASRDVNIVPALAEDPRITGATLQLFGANPGDGATGTINLSAALWQGIGNPPGSKGYIYLDPTLSNGVRKVVFKQHGFLIVSARGANWPYQITQAQGPITFRFQVGTHVYCTEFFDFERNDVGFVLARDSPRPLSCGPIVCGDGVVQGNEECDDGDLDPADGCSPSCELEDRSAICSGISSQPGTAITSVLVARNLRFPVHAAAPPLDPNRLFVVEQWGVIKIIKNGDVLDTPFLDIRDRVKSGGEQGLLSIAFHPQFETNGRFFVDYTNNSGDTVISRFEVGANPDDADESSEKILITIDQPFDNHNGGQLAFDADGYLYAGKGDGGQHGDPGERAQDDTELLGKMLRFDVNVETPPYYAIPPDNPNAAAGHPLGLIWAKGLRNPWRFSFDRTTDDLYIGDVGEAAIEEINFQPAASTGAENYGWDVFQGTQCFNPQPHFPSCPMPATGFAMPVHEYTHAEGCSVTGGFVYRGCRLPDLRGTYFYADFCRSFIRTFQVSGGVATDHLERTAEVVPVSGQRIGPISSFAEDARGELYIVDYNGRIFKIIPAP